MGTTKRGWDKISPQTPSQCCLWSGENSNLICSLGSKGPGTCCERGQPASQWSFSLRDTHLMWHTFGACCMLPGIKTGGHYLHTSSPPCSLLGLHHFFFPAILWNTSISWMGAFDTRLLPRFLLLLSDTSSQPDSGGQWGFLSRPHRTVTRGERVLKQPPPSGHSQRQLAQKLSLSGKGPWASDLLILAAAWGAGCWLNTSGSCLESFPETSQNLRAPPGGTLLLLCSRVLVPLWKSFLFLLLFLSCFPQL